MVKRGLVGVQLAISDAHADLKAAIAKVLGCSLQRCTVHFLRDCLGHARRDQHGLLAALIRPIFNAENLEQARDRLSEAVAHLDGRLGKIAGLLEDAEPDILAFYALLSAPVTGRKPLLLGRDVRARRIRGAFTLRLLRWARRIAERAEHTAVA